MQAKHNRKIVLQHSLLRHARVQVCHCLPEYIRHYWVSVRGFFLLTTTWSCVPLQRVGISTMLQAKFWIERYIFGKLKVRRRKCYTSLKIGRDGAYVTAILNASYNPGKKQKSPSASRSRQSWKEGREVYPYTRWTTEWCVLWHYVRA